MVAEVHDGSDYSCDVLEVEPRVPCAHHRHNDSEVVHGPDGQPSAGHSVQEFLSDTEAPHGLGLGF